LAPKKGPILDKKDPVILLQTVMILPAAPPVAGFPLCFNKLRGIPAIDVRRLTKIPRLCGTRRHTPIFI